MAAAAACSRPGARHRCRARSGPFDDRALDIKGLLVGLAQGGHHAVERQLHFAPLQPLLQFGLGVLAHGAHLGMIRHRLYSRAPGHGRPRKPASR
jgi:hypothetical protein